MLMREYLSLHGFTAYRFALLLKERGVLRNYNYFYRYLNGLRRPSDKVRIAIEEVTNGQVTASDWARTPRREEAKAA
jgi:hypothetical protein